MRDQLCKMLNINTISWQPFLNCIRFQTVGLYGMMIKKNPRKYFKLHFYDDVEGGL